MKKNFISLLVVVTIAVVTVFDLPSATGESSVGEAPANKPEEAAIYFNAATEIYLQGDYFRTLENLEKAAILVPKDKQIMDFLSRVIVEAGTHYNLTRDYKNAMHFLEKGRSLLPGDKKIEQLYLITGDVLKRQKPELQIKETPPPSPPQKEELLPKTTPAATAETPRPAPASKPATVRAKTVDKKPAPAPAITPAPALKPEIPARLIILAGDRKSVV